MKEARLLLREGRRALRRYGYRLSEKAQQAVREAIDELAKAVAEKKKGTVGPALNALDKALDDYLSFARKSTVREYTESIAVAVLIALFLRAFVVEAFKIPSGSMIPTLEVGDHIFVNKFIYGIRVPWTNLKFGMSYRKPRRGEVIVFVYPKDPDKDFIKRIVAVEGDKVEVKDNQVFVNEHAVPREQLGGEFSYEDYDEASDHWDTKHCEKWQETLEGNKFMTVYESGGKGPSSKLWGPKEVPPNHVFVMGDNRDNSHDSRYWGFVPFQNIKGKAMFIWLSAGPSDPDEAPPIRWLKSLRMRRMFHLVQ